MGERLSPLPLTLRSDPALPGLRGAPFVVAHASGGDTSVFDNGLPLTPTDWIRDGELAELITTRHSAGLTGLPVRPAIDNLIFEAPTGAGATLDEMIARTERGLLLTCLWYIREVDPATLLLTGPHPGRRLPRRERRGEGGGEQLPLQRVPGGPARPDHRGRAARSSRLPREWSDYFTRAAMPPVRVADFHMSSVSQAS